MSEEHQLPSDSDDDDEDYVPGGADSDPVSEVESEGDVESGPEDENDENKRDIGQRKGTRKSVKRKGKNSRCKKTVDNKSKLSEEENGEKEEGKEKKELTEEEEKKRADSLWADFMKDTGTNIAYPYSYWIHSQ